MFSIPKLLILLACGAGLYLWLRNNQFRERALQIAVVQCREAGIQHLDQNVVLKSMWSRRNKKGGWVFRRTFHFEFTSTGERRHQGIVIFDGHNLVSVELDAHRIPQLH